MRQATATSCVEYAARLPVAELETLFEGSGYAVQGLFRALPPPAKALALRIWWRSVSGDEEAPLSARQLLSVWLAKDSGADATPAKHRRGRPGAEGPETTASNGTGSTEHDRVAAHVLQSLLRVGFLRQVALGAAGADADVHSSAYGEAVAYEMPASVQDHLSRFLFGTGARRRRLLDTFGSISNTASTRKVQGGSAARGPFAVFVDAEVGDTASCKVDQRIPLSALDEHARTAWEQVLHFLVGTPAAVAAPAYDVVGAEADGDGRGAPSSHRRPAPTPSPPSDEIVEALLRLGVSEPVGTDGMRITDRGFSYLLMDTTAQIWTLLEDYMNSRGGDVVERHEMLDLLFRFGFAVVGRRYAVTDASLSDRQRRMLAFLAEVGLVYLGDAEVDARAAEQRRREEQATETEGFFLRKRPLNASRVEERAPAGASTAAIASATASTCQPAPNISANFAKRLHRSPHHLYFTPTRLGADMVQGNRVEGVLAAGDGFGRHSDVLIEAPSANAAAATPLPLSRTPGAIGLELVIETNFRVYAYCTSLLQIELLSLFTRLLYRLPNMAIGVLTRDSVRSALRTGITGSQIVHFLAAHVLHGQPVPYNVRDQILLWESEQRRVQMQPAVLFDDFAPTADGQALYQQVSQHAAELGARLWCDPSRQLLVVHAEAFDATREFIRRHT
ncbi:hypothetical protein CDCA_CDCA07G2177 [Cyanidium caldarium]|uniref:General transcription factor IIH subunit 4 n=1 Tax=Cyanidium caldarium TaxID=2771 RepID=A0AAV9IV63_CYACA|nr:hypothetical protein CDCA_CDCA07G2177 [Cyanidium caldarium]